VIDPGAVKTPLAMRASLVDMAEVGWDAAVAVITPAVAMVPAAAMSLLRCFSMVVPPTCL
jgi:hypothetical protein